MQHPEHIDRDTFKQIFRDHWEDFKKTCPEYDTDYYSTVVQKMLDCGDPEKMGFAQYRCIYCGETRRIAFSCKSCFCLSCSKPYTDRWVEFIIVLQTAGRPGNYNPHLHILVTAGGINPAGQWQSVSYIPFDMIHRKWQYYLLNMLRANADDPAVEKDVDRGWRKYPKGFVAHIQEGEVPPGGQGLAPYLAKYVVSPPISVRRIEQYDGDSQLLVSRPSYPSNRAHHPSSPPFYRPHAPARPSQRLPAHSLLRSAQQRPLCPDAPNNRTAHPER